MVDKLSVGFSRPYKHPFPILSWLIRLIEWTRFSHVYVSFTTKSGHSLVLHASGFSVNLLNKQIFLNKNKIIKTYEFTLTTEQRKTFFKFMFQSLGLSYSFKQLFGILLARTFNLKYNILSQGNQSQVCSELVGYILRDVLNYRLDFNLDLAGPKQLYRYINKLTQDK